MLFANNILSRFLTYPGSLTVVTTLVAVTALYVYWKQRDDQRRDAAGIVLREIIRAEQAIPNVKKIVKEFGTNLTPDKVRVMPTANWSQAQIVLARKLPSDILQAISDFYANCQLLDESLASVDSAFYENAQQARVNQFRMAAKYHVENIDLEHDSSDESTNPAYNPTESFEEFVKAWPLPNSAYYPKKIFKDVEKSLELLPDSLQHSRIGQYLRHLEKGLWQRLWEGKPV